MVVTWVPSFMVITSGISTRTGSSFTPGMTPRAVGISGTGISRGSGPSDGTGLVGGRGLIGCIDAVWCAQLLKATAAISEILILVAIPKVNPPTCLVASDVEFRQQCEERIIFRPMNICNRLMTLGWVALLCGCASGTPPLPDAVPLWNGVAPGSEGQTAPEKYSIQHVAASANNPAISFAIVTDVNSPSITPFLPSREKATGVAVIIAPGGGHQMLAIEHEGYAVGRYLADHGVAGFVLKYRLAQCAGVSVQN